MIEAGDLKRGVGLLRNCASARRTRSRCPATPTRDRDIARLIDDEMRAAGLAIAPDARAALLPRCSAATAALRAPSCASWRSMRTGRSAIEIDDVMAVVADASALALDALIDAAFAGRLGDVEKEFSQGDRRRHQSDRDRRRRAAPARAPACAAARRSRAVHLSAPRSSSAQPPIHFRRKPLVETALKAWTSERLAKAMAMLAEASLDARRVVRSRRNDRTARLDADCARGRAARVRCH